MKEGKKTFLEVGTCYFDTLNYLADRGWQGIQVEPIKKYQDKIERKDDVHYENSAIYWENTKELEMAIAPEDVVAKDSDFAGMSSLVRKNNRYLTEKVLVNGITFETLFKKYDVKIKIFSAVQVGALGPWGPGALPPSNLGGLAPPGGGRK